MIAIYPLLRPLIKSFLMFGAITLLAACSSGGDRLSGPSVPVDGYSVLATTPIQAPVSREALDFYINTRGVMVGIFSEPGDAGLNALFNGVYRSVDAGLSWDLLDESRYYRQVFVHPDGDVFALTDESLWRYSVAGVWEDITPPSGPNFQISPYSKLGMLPSGALFVKDDIRSAGYMNYSTAKGSGGGAWDYLKNPANILSAGAGYHDFMIADSSQLLVKYGDDVFLSPEGKNFTKVYDFATHGFNVSRMSYGSDNKIYLMDGLNAWSTADLGASYQPVSGYVALADEAIGFANIDAFNGNLYYHSSPAVGWGQRYFPYVSADGGQSWSIAAHIDHLTTSRSFGAKLYFLSTRLGVLELTADGRLLSFGPRPDLVRYKSYVTSIASDNAGRLLAVANKELVRSDDDGATWEVLKGDSLNQHVLVASDNTLVVAGGQDYFAFSSDAGASWAEQRSLRSGLGGINTIREIYETNGRLYVSAYESYRDPISDISECREPYLGVIDAYDATLMTWQALPQPLGGFYQQSTALQAIQTCPGEYLQGRQSVTFDYFQSLDNGATWSSMAYSDYLGGFYSPVNAAVRGFFSLNTEILNINGIDYRLTDVANEEGVYVSGFDAFSRYIYVNYTTGAMFRTESGF